MCLCVCLCVWGRQRGAGRRDLLSGLPVDDLTVGLHDLHCALHSWSRRTHLVALLCLLEDSGEVTAQLCSHRVID